MGRILIYTENYLPGGGNRYLIDIVNSIDSNTDLYIVSNKKGLFSFDLQRINCKCDYSEISVITFPSVHANLAKKNKFIRLTLKLTIKCFRFILLFFFKRINLSLLSKKIKEVNPDLILSCNGGYPGGYTCLDMIYASKANHVPVILTVVSVPQTKNDKIFDFFYGNILNHCRNVIVNTSVISKVFTENWGFPSEKFITLHNCINLNEFANVDPTFSSVLRSTYHCENSMIIGFIGRIEELKGVYVLLEAFSKVTEYDKRVKLVLVGSGEIEKAKLFSEKLGISESVVFTGFFDGNIYDILNSFDIFVFPSLWEGLPYAILEAMALKKIIVSTNVGGISEVIESEVSGLLVNPNDSIQLAAELIRVLENFDTFKQLGVHAYEKLTLKLSLSEFADKINKLINSSIQEFTAL